MPNQTFSFAARLARKVPDPVFEQSHRVTRYILFVPVRSVPAGIPQDPDPRVPNINRQVYREVEESLMEEDGEPGTFHLKHKGITIVAEKVESRDGEHIVTIRKGQGILDGAHTYALLNKHREDDDLPTDQFVKVEILTGVPTGWIPEIAGGLNSSVQVQPMSLDHLAGKFDWIKKELRDADYFGKIAWRENEQGEMDARDIISILTCFNVELFPNDGVQHPVTAYEKKSQALKLFEEKEDSYKKLRPLLKDILRLHDTIRHDSRKYWNAAGGSFGKLAFVEHRRRGDFEFPFIGQKSEYRLTSGALYPILAAFRWMVEEDPKNGDFRWRGGFGSVLERWESSAEELLRTTAQASGELGRNPNAVGKSRSLWSNLHSRVGLRDMMAKRRSRATV